MLTISINIWPIIAIGPNNHTLRSMISRVWFGY